MVLRPCKRPLCLRDPIPFSTDSQLLTTFVDCPVGCCARHSRCPADADIGGGGDATTEGRTRRHGCMMHVLRLGSKVVGVEC